MRSMCSSILFRLTLFFLFSVFFAHAEVTTIQSLNFGTLVVTNNSFRASVIIDPAGNIQVIGGIAVIDAGNNAVYELSNLPPNTIVRPDFQVINSQMIGDINSEETFTLTLLPNQNTLISDTNGTAILTLGGRIDTSGSGSIRFTDTNYESTIQITINL